MNLTQRLTRVHYPRQAKPPDAPTSLSGQMNWKEEARKTRKNPKDAGIERLQHITLLTLLTL
jgi:hypothetical protein